MCGILGIVGHQGAHVNQLLYDGLTVLQHRVKTLRNSHRYRRAFPTAKVQRLGR